MEPDLLISVKEASDLAEVNPRTIRRWITSGRLPAEKTPDGYQVRADDVVWATSHVTPQTLVLRQPVKPDRDSHYDLIPVIARMEELIRENEQLRAENRTLDDRLRALAAPEPRPWYRRWRQSITREKHHATPVPDDARPCGESSDRRLEHPRPSGPGSEDDTEG